MPEFNMFCGIGKPILQSKSQQMYNSVFNEMGINAVYVRLAASNGEDAIETISEMGIAGFSITSPFKLDMLGFLDSSDRIVQKLNAVNIVSIKNGKSIGHNTDHLGVAGALSSNGVEMNGKKAVVLGAGGAAAAAAYALLNNGSKVVIVNRTFGKAHELSESLGCTCARVDRLEEELKSAHILISCIPGTHTPIRGSFLRKGLVFMDANYSNSKLSALAKKNGCKIISGADWLAFQAIPAFKIFTGKKADVAVFRKVLSVKPAKKPNISLIGFMGSGKSTVGKIISEKLGMEFVDLDKVVENKACKSIAQIFLEEGEPAFRLAETAAIEMMKNAKGKVFSCGGGAIMDSRNRKTIKENSICIWLWVRPEIAIDRLKDDFKLRPLLEGASSPAQKAKSMMTNRMRSYAETCDLVINSGNKTPEKVAERIIYEIDNAFGN